MVQIIIDDQTPWGWAGMLTGSFVVIAALVAYFSHRSSDKRKLARKYQRQWDPMIKDGYIATSTAVDNLLDLKDQRFNDKPNENETHARARAIVDGLLARAKAFDPIASSATAGAMNEVTETAKSTINLMHDGLYPKPERVRVYRAEEELLAQTKKALRITK